MWSMFNRKDKERIAELEAAVERYDSALFEMTNLSAAIFEALRKAAEDKQENLKAGLYSDSSDAAANVRVHEAEYEHQMWLAYAEFIHQTCHRHDLPLHEMVYQMDLVKKAYYRTMQEFQEEAEKFDPAGMDRALLEFLNEENK